MGKEKYEKWTEEVLHYAYTFPYNGFYMQFYPWKTIGFQLEIGRRRWESYTEYILRGLKTSVEKARVWYTPINLIYKFQFLKDKKMYPYLLIGGGLEIGPEWWWQYQSKFGAGIKYSLSPSEEKKR